MSGTTARWKRCITSGYIPWITENFVTRVPFKKQRVKLRNLPCSQIAPWRKTRHQGQRAVSILLSKGLRRCNQPYCSQGAFVLHIVFQLSFKGSMPKTSNVCRCIAFGPKFVYRSSRLFGNPSGSAAAVVHCSACQQTYHNRHELPPQHRLTG